MTLRTVLFSMCSVLAFFASSGAGAAREAVETPMPAGGCVSPTVYSHCSNQQCQTSRVNGPWTTCSVYRGGSPADLDGDGIPNERQQLQVPRQHGSGKL